MNGAFRIMGMWCSGSTLRSHRRDGGSIPPISILRSLPVSGRTEENKSPWNWDCLGLNWVCLALFLRCPARRFSLKPYILFAPFALNIFSFKIKSLAQQGSLTKNSKLKIQNFTFPSCYPIRLSLRAGFAQDRFVF